MILFESINDTTKKGLYKQGAVTDFGWSESITISLASAKAGSCACLNYLGLGLHDKALYGKGDEEGKIGSEHGGSSDHVFVLDSACAIGISEMIHQRSTLNTKTDHHLSYLAKSNAVIGPTLLNYIRVGRYHT